MILFYHDLFSKPNEEEKYEEDEESDENVVDYSNLRQSNINIETKPEEEYENNKHMMQPKFIGVDVENACMFDDDANMEHRQVIEEDKKVEVFIAHY